MRGEPGGGSNRKRREEERRTSSAAAHSNRSRKLCGSSPGYPVCNCHPDHERSAGPRSGAWPAVCGEFIPPYWGSQFFDVNAVW